jgi:hypothetical protein
MKGSGCHNKSIPKAWRRHERKFTLSRKKDNPGGLFVAHQEGEDLKEGLKEELRRSGSEWQQVRVKEPSR